MLHIGIGPIEYVAGPPDLLASEHQGSSCAREVRISEEVQVL